MEKRMDDDEEDTVFQQAHSAEFTSRPRPIHRNIGFFLGVGTVLLIITLVVVVSHRRSSQDAADLGPDVPLTDRCDKPCDWSFVESIPTGLFPNETVAHTGAELVQLVGSARKTIHIAALYWNLRDPSFEYPTKTDGATLFLALASAARDRSVKIEIAEDGAGGLSTDSDSKYLAERGLAQVRSLNFSALFGSGVLHTKLVIVDLQHIYIGSANMDWKSLSEVKELGLVVRSCPCLASDLFRIFYAYWLAGEKNQIPEQWPTWMRTPFNSATPLGLSLSTGLDVATFFSSGPRQLNPNNRDDDGDTIARIIDGARESVCVSVMDYVPELIYDQSARTKPVFWAKLDNAIRSAAVRGVRVRLLISEWAHTKPQQLLYLTSLLALNGMKHGKLRKTSIEIRVFRVPSTPEQKKIKFARVNHAKYLVADQIAYVGTSNWVGDYFETTAGVGLILNSTSSPNPSSPAAHLQHIFDRDWMSVYANPL